MNRFKCLLSALCLWRIRSPLMKLVHRQILQRRLEESPFVQQSKRTSWGGGKYQTSSKAKGFRGIEEALESGNPRSKQTASRRGGCGLFGRQMLNVEQFRKTLYSGCTITIERTELARARLTP